MKSSLHTGNPRDAYRLSDVVKGYMREHEAESYNRCLTRYPNTIASKYITATQDLPDVDKDNNIPILDSIIDNNPVDHASMHIRAYDILTGYDAGEYIYDQTRGGLNNFQPKQLLEYGVVDLLKQDNITTVYLFCANHYSNNSSKLTLQMIEECANILKDNGLAIQHANEPHPDDAFTHMCNSKFMIGTQLGFSYLACQIVNHRKRPAFFGSALLS